MRGAYIFPEVKPSVGDLGTEILEPQFGALARTVATERLGLIDQGERFCLSFNRKGESLSVGD
jgi:hypothetical protein